VKLVNETPFEVAWLLWSVRPPKPHLTVVVKATFDLPAEGECPIAGAQLLATGDELHDESLESLRHETDLAPLKPRGEVLVVGTYRPPPGRPVRSAALGFSVGGVTKQLAIWGDRQLTPFGGVTAPEPIEAVPLRWERSFGGPGFEANPLGRGIAAADVGGRSVVALPNIERPEALIAASGDRPQPAGCWPLPRSFAARAGLLGSYRGSWLEKRWPYFPEDFDWAYFNAAPADQRIDGYFRGDEAIMLMGALPDAPALRCRLPGLRVRALVELEDPSVPLFPLEPNLDTITVDLDARKVTCLWRAGLEVEDDKLTGFRRLYVRHEKLDAPARTVAEERAALQARLAALAAEEEGAPGAGPPPGPPPPPLANDPEARAALRAKVEAARAGGGSLAGLVLAGADLAGLDLGGANLANAILTGASLRGAKLDGAKLEGAVLQGADLTGASLRGASLAGADLTGCQGAGLTFEETALDDAIAIEAQLAGARFVRVSLRKVDLSRAALAGATFEDCDLGEGDLSGAVLDDATFVRCKLVDAWMGAGASAKRARFDGCELALLRASDGLDLTQASLRAVKAAGARLGGARLDRANLSLSVLDDASFGEASLVSAALLGCRLRRARFDRARLIKAELGKSDLFQASFEAADLRGADLRGCSLYGAELWKANLEGALLEGADLAGTKLAGA
jgi:uncharacterized protein YjbI with pentapeptide repeats